MGRYEHGIDDILTEVQTRTGLKLEIFNSGGWTMILEARLESGHYLWVSDADADVCPAPRRYELEAEGLTLGWMVGIYPPDPECDTWADADTLCASVTHHTARTADLPDVVALALCALPDNAHHTITATDHTVAHGIHHL